MTRRRGSAALLRAAHAGPTAVVTAITVLLAVAAGVRPAGVVLLGIGMAAGQLSVGWSNDWIDAPLDRAAGRADKPAATGAVRPATLRTAALVALVPGLALPFGASPAAGGLHVLFVASAWAYNLGLKRTPASVLPYVVSFGLLPAIASLARQPAPGAAPGWPAAWTLVVGAVLGVAAHFANVVPDIAIDRAAGVRGLPQLLGARGSGVVAAVVLLVGVVVAALGVRATDTVCVPSCGGSPTAAAAALGAAALAGVVGLAAGVLARPSRLPFRLVMLAALLLVVALLLTPAALR